MAIFPGANLRLLSMWCISLSQTDCWLQKNGGEKQLKTKEMARFRLSLTRSQMLECAKCCTCMEPGLRTAGQLSPSQPASQEKSLQF